MLPKTVAALALAGAALCGCGTQVSTVQVQSPNAPTKSIATAEPALSDVLPAVSRVVPNGDLIGWTVSRLEFEKGLTDQCLAQRGQEKSVLLVTRDSAAEDVYARVYGVAIGASSSRARSGYGMTANLPGGINYQELGPENIDPAADPVREQALTECQSRARFSPDELTAQWLNPSKDSWEVSSATNINEIRTNWQQCMRNSTGRDFGPPEDLVTTSAELSDHSPTEILEREVRPILDSDPTSETPEITALRQKEIRWAEADWECRKQFVNPTIERVRQEKEISFLSKHISELDRITPLITSFDHKR